MKNSINYSSHKSNIYTSFLMGLLILVYLIIYNPPIFAQNEDGSAKEHEDFRPENFDESSINITNKWMPLKPGTRMVYEGTTIEDGEKIDHRVVITVTDMTKEIDGVNSLVTWDLDYSNGELVEAEIAFFAQDKNGNVWRMGEHPEEYEEGKFILSSTWIHGVEGSIAGISMHSEPKLDMPSYSQGWAPSVDFTDRAQVDQIGIKNCVPLDCYENVLVVAESSESEPDAQQLKYFAPNVGNIRVGWRGEGEKTQETLELVEIQQLVLGAFDEARNEALKLEKHAYEISKDVYGATKPMQQRKME